MIKTGTKTADPGFGFRICCASWDPLDHAKRGFVTHLPCKFFSALKILFEAWLPHSDRQKKMWMFFRTQIHIQCDRYTLCWHYAILTCGMQVLCCLGRPLWRGWFPARDIGKMVSKAVCLYLVMNKKWDSLIHPSLIWVTFHISSHLGHVWGVLIILKCPTCTDKYYFAIELQGLRVPGHAPSQIF